LFLYMILNVLGLTALAQELLAAAEEIIASIVS
jgi:hypothetical protein